MESWYINEAYPKEVQALFSDVDRVFALKGEEVVSEDSICSVTKLTVNDRCFYIKRYIQPGKETRKYFGRSRCRAEWENLVFCQELGIPTPTIVACGEEFTFFGYKVGRGALITEAVPGAMDLRTLIQVRPDLLKHETWKPKVLGIIADYVGRLHRHHFVHGDLKFRNMLVTSDEKNPKVYFFDMPAGKRLFGFRYRRGMKKDLAILNKYAERILSRSARLRFYLIYKIEARLNKKDKKFIKSLLNLYRKRNERTRN